MKKIWSFILALAFAMVLSAPIPALADDSMVVIEGKLATSENAGDITGDGTFAYDEESHTLYINKDVNYSGSSPIINTYGSSDLTIVLSDGVTSIENNGSAPAFYISVDLTILGTDDITITQKDMSVPMFSAGMKSDESGTASVKIRTNGDITINNNGKSYCGYINELTGKSITVTGDNPGAPLFLSACEFTANEGDVKIESSGSRVLFNQSVSMKGNNVTITDSASGQPLFSANSDIIADGDVTIENHGSGYIGYLTNIEGNNITVSSPEATAPCIMVPCEVNAKGNFKMSAGKIYAFYNTATVKAKDINIEVANSGPMFPMNSQILGKGDVSLVNKGTGFIGSVSSITGKNISVSCASSSPAITSDTSIEATGRVAVMNQGGIALAGATDIKAKSLEITSVGTVSSAVTASFKVVADSASIVSESRAIAGTASFESLSGAKIELNTGADINNLTLAGIQDNFLDYRSDAAAIMYKAHTHSGKWVVTKKATCTAKGEQTKTCVCGDVFTKDIPAAGHKTTTTVTKATTSKNGSKITKCSVCGKQTAKTTIYYPKSITLSATEYVSDGNAKKPTVKVVDANAKTIAAGNYTLTYDSGRKNVGKYKVKIAFKGNYSGTVSKEFKILPKATSLSSLTAASKSFTVNWKKQATQTTGYQIQYATDSKFTKDVKSVTVSKNGTTSTTVKKLTGKKKYYVRIRTYKTVNSTKYYSSWSGSKAVTTKQ